MDRWTKDKLSSEKENKKNHLKNTQKLERDKRLKHYIIEAYIKTQTKCLEKYGIYKL